MTAITGINFTTQEASKLKNYGKGLITNFKLATPVLSEYATGDYFSKLNETTENLSDTQDGKEDGVFKKTLKGAWKQFVLSLPIIGTYQLGKTKEHHDNAKGRIDSIKNGTEFHTQHSGVFKTYIKGLGEKIKHSIPFYGTYYRGKIANEVNNMYQDSKVINDAGAWATEA